LHIDSTGRKRAPAYSGRGRFMPMTVSAASSTSPSLVRPPWRARGLLFIHALLIPAMLGAAATAFEISGLDDRITASFFDPAAQQFPARDWAVFELIGHRIAKSSVWIVWLLLAAAVVASYRVDRLLPYRAVLWTTTIAMALGPAVVLALKGVNAVHCPWDLKRFGGYADFSAAWFVAPAEVGHCFPSGHAAGGFSLAAVYFAGALVGNTRVRFAALALVLTTGVAFSAVRVVQGAHFVSHNLWSAAIDWSLAACAFAALLALADRGKAPPLLEPWKP
jgi:membrane-associated PAP2 superfamily phosphatase